MYRAIRASMPVEAPPVQGQGQSSLNTNLIVSYIFQDKNFFKNFRTKDFNDFFSKKYSLPKSNDWGVTLKNFVNIGIKSLKEKIKNDADLVKFLQGVTQSKSNDINKLFSIEALQMINETHKDYVRMKKNKAKDSKKTVAKSDCPPCPPCGQPGSNKSKFGSSSNNNILLLLILLGVVLYFYKKKSSGSLFGKRRRR